MARILLIEDDFAIRKMLRRTLTHYGHTVLEASNGMEGLQLLPQINADLLITDLVMPGKGGFDVLLELRDHKPPVKVIVISGGVVGETACRLEVAKSFGAARVLAKPFTMIELVALVDSLLREGGPLTQPMVAR